MAYRITSIAAGLFLLTAALLKASSAGPETNPLLQKAGHLVGLLAVQVEFALGLWLLTGAFPSAARFVGAATFAAFAAVNAWLGMQGESSCGCLGRHVSVNPWAMMALDLAVSASLLTFRPRARTAPAGWPERVAIGIGVAVLAVGLTVGGISVWGDPDDVAARLSGAAVTARQDVVSVGEGPPQDHRTVVVELRNHSPRPVRVVGSRSSCSCTTATDLPTVIPAGGVRPIEVAVTLKGTPGRFMQRVLFYTDDGRQGVVAVWVQGTIRE